MIKVHRSTDGQFYFTINAGNGQVLAHSETYKTKRSLRGGIKSAIKVLTIKTEYMIKVHRSTDGQFYFTINAGNGQVLAHSETYKTKRSLRGGIKSAIRAVTDPALLIPNFYDIVLPQKIKEL